MASREERGASRQQRDHRRTRESPAERDDRQWRQRVEIMEGAGTARVDVPGGGPLPNSPSFRAMRGADGWHWTAAGARERRAQTHAASHRRERRPPPPPWRTLGSASEEGLPAGDLRGQARRAERERKESGKRAQRERKESGKRAEREREEETASSPRPCVAMRTSATRAEVVVSSSRSPARTEGGKFRAIVRK